MHSAVRDRDIEFESAFDRNSLAIYLSHKDPETDGRSWITEACIDVQDTGPRLFTRISCRQPRNSLQPFPRAPRFLSQIVKSVGASDAALLEGIPEQISGANVNGLTGLLTSDFRRLPVIVVSEDQRTDSFCVDANELASYLCGVAHVVTIDWVAARSLTEFLGSRELSVFHGGVRCYCPGLRPDDDIFKHKLWTREAISRLDAARRDGFLNWCVGHTFSVVTAQFEPFQMLSPSALRRRKEELDAVALASATAASAIEEVPPAAARVLTLSPEGGLPSGPAVSEHGPSGIPVPDESVKVAFAVNEETGVLEISGTPKLVEDLRFDIGDIRLIEGLFREASLHKLSALQTEVQRLEEMLREARDETAQKNSQIIRLEPFEQEALELKEEQKLLRGEYEAKDSAALKDFWDGFNMFFETAKTLASEAKRVKSQESTIEQIQEEIRRLKTTLYQRDRTIEALKGGNEFLDEPDPDPPSSWDEVVARAKVAMKYLTISDEIEECLQSCPFNSGIAESVERLLGILNSIAEESNDDCSLTERGLQIREHHFVGKNASFSDESDTNRRDFKSELTFKDPESPAKKIECTWHGKINQEQFRIHFEWPRPRGQRRIKVVYIGPKLTKH